MAEKFSVLMSVYKNETVSNFELAFDSVISQSVAPDEILLVRDGEVPDELQNSIDTLVERYGDLITYIPRKENRGLGEALRLGVEMARNSLIARMDTDDVAAPDRFKHQLEAFEADPELSVVGGQILEFTDSIDNIVGERRVPLTDGEIRSYLESRNAFNHPTVMFRREAVLSAGNYIEKHFVEDYYLWLRMMLNGAKFANVDKTLVYMRVSLDMYQRRGGYAYFKILKELEGFKKKNGITGSITYLKNVVLRFVQCVLLPNKLRGFMYRKVLRRSEKGSERDGAEADNKS